VLSKRVAPALKQAHRSHQKRPQGHDAGLPPKFQHLVKPDKSKRIPAMLSEYFRKIGQMRYGYTATPQK
jgi:hypothetical protein